MRKKNNFRLKKQNINYFIFAVFASLNKEKTGLKNCYYVLKQNNGAASYFLLYLQ